MKSTRVIGFEFLSVTPHSGYKTVALYVNSYELVTIESCLVYGSRFDAETMAHAQATVKHARKLGINAWCANSAWQLKFEFHCSESGSWYGCTLKDLDLYGRMHSHVEYLAKLAKTGFELCTPQGMVSALLKLKAVPLISDVYDPDNGSLGYGYPASKDWQLPPELKNKE